MENIIGSLKEFIWDIIGYLIPGFALLMAMNLVLLTSLGTEKSFMFQWDSFAPYSIIVLSYLAGYIVYALTIYKVKVQDLILFKLVIWLKWFPWFSNLLNKSISTCWEEKFIKSSTFINAKKHLKDKGFENTEKMKLNEVRNILMSRDPSMDEKVYTFMFRSSVFDHLSTIFILIEICVVIQFLFAFQSIYFISTTSEFKVFYLIVIPIIPLLGRCKRMFFPIAKRIPFSNLK